MNKIVHGPFAAGLLINSVEKLHVTDAKTRRMGNSKISQRPALIKQLETKSKSRTFFPTSKKRRPMVAGKRGCGAGWIAGRTRKEKERQSTITEDFK
ncbi:hypothetical protein AXW38_10095 [Yersinia ruckeri]|nr:hypothetical protein AXW19_10055 [Yersinia ruckeri]OIX33667.1 hypothetical protein AXW18_10075 [Yersinia ruckeri]OIX33878.1 hypothetical protein AXW20_10085 [Yersinia ruckeri]OIX44499.1 hypothetical protein AXW21_10095 [Yersinia ruckeri]OIX44852.1 hypothetical protein AXW23_10065 [Yersinia ruckeri]